MFLEMENWLDRERMKNCEVYQEIYYSQFPEEKLREKINYDEKGEA